MRVVSFDQKAKAMKTPAQIAAPALRRGDAAQTSAASTHITAMLSRKAIRWYQTASGARENNRTAAAENTRRSASRRASR